MIINVAIRRRVLGQAVFGVSSKGSSKDEGTVSADNELF